MFEIVPAHVLAFASITGAWIETLGATFAFGSSIFASITGAWIETAIAFLMIVEVVSRPSRARGLKLACF